MKTLTYIFTSILSCMFIFLASYLIGDRILNYQEGNKGALVARFIEPKEIRSFDNLLLKLPSERIISPALAADGQSMLYYNQDSGYIHSLEAVEDDYRNRTLQRLPPYLKDVQWSQYRNMIAGNDGSNYVIYDLGAGTSTELPKNILELQFSPSGEKIAYISSDLTKPGAGELNISYPDLRSTEKLMSLSSFDWGFKWIDKDRMEVSYRQSKRNISDIFILSIQSREFTKFISGTADLETLWSPNGRSLLYSDLEHGQTAIYFKRTVYSDGVRLPLESKLSSCAWALDSKTIYCASNTVSEADASDSFVNISTSDPLVIKYLKVNDLYELKTEALLLSADERYLFIKNSLDSKIYRLIVELLP